MVRISNRDYTEQYFKDHLFYVTAYLNSLSNRDKLGEFQQECMTLAIDYIKDRSLRILSLISPQREHLILDLGCGVGTLTIECAKRELFAVGIDFSNNAVKISKNLTRKLKITGNSEIVRADVQHLPFVPNVFDRIIAADLVEHLYRDQYRTALNDWFTALKNGGKIVIYTDNPDHLKYRSAFPFRLFSKLSSLFLRPIPIRPDKRLRDHVSRFTSLHVDLKSAAYLLKTLRQAGFDIVNRMFYLDVFSHQAHAYFIKRIYNLVRALPGIGSALELFACAHMSIVGKKSS